MSEILNVFYSLMTSNVEICQSIFLDIFISDEYNNDTIDCRKKKKGGTYESKRTKGIIRFYRQITG